MKDAGLLCMVYLSLLTRILPSLENFANLHILTFCHVHSCWVLISPESAHYLHVSQVAWESFLCIFNRNSKEYELGT